jgi:hypothetical protein
MERITVRATGNPTPYRGWDYDAWYGDIDLGAIVGHGATPNEAIADLEEIREWRAIGGLDV